MPVKLRVNVLNTKEQRGRAAAGIAALVGFALMFPIGGAVWAQTTPTVSPATPTGESLVTPLPPSATITSTLPSATTPDGTLGVLPGTTVVPLTPGAPSSAPVVTPEVQPGVVVVTAILPPTLEATPELSPTPSPTLPPPVSLEAAEALPTIVAARSDLELLATTALGAIRPTGWSGMMDVNDPEISLFLRLDLENLAGATLGADVRPAGWFGVVPSTPLAIARDIRHDLELLADQVIGTATIRPAGWTGDDPIMRCNRATQSLNAVLEREGFALNIDFTAPDACLQAELEASRFVERTIIQPPSREVGAAPDGQGGSASAFDPYVVDTPFVPAYYDRRARFRAGVLPIGTGFDTLSRSTVDYSNMTLVTGDGFTLFVDYTTIPITAEEFLALPDVGGGEPTTDCNADWCEPR